MNALVATLALALAAPLAATQAPAARPLTDAQVRSAVHTYLGSIDTPISAARWQALGPRAETELLAVAAADALPSRRAKAIDGLTALGSSQSQPLFSKLAAAEGEALSVRYAAIRGLGRLLPEPQLLPALEPLLEHSRDARVRAYAGQQLTRRIPSSGCRVLRAQVAREAAATRPQFDRAREPCLGI